MVGVKFGLSSVRKRLVVGVVCLGLMLSGSVSVACDEYSTSLFCGMVDMITKIKNKFLDVDLNGTFLAIRDSCEVHSVPLLVPDVEQLLRKSQNNTIYLGWKGGKEESVTLQIKKNADSSILCSKTVLQVISPSTKIENCAFEVDTKYNVSINDKKQGSFKVTNTGCYAKKDVVRLQIELRNEQVNETTSKEAILSIKIAQQEPKQCMLEAYQLVAADDSDIFEKGIIKSLLIDGIVPR